jgi:hypothetical protein
MSYDIYFVKKKNLTHENVWDVLEILEPTPDNEIYISKDLMISIVDTLQAKGLKFEIFERDDEDYLELNFPSYQVSMFNSQIVILLPYWDENGEDGIDKEVKLITNVLLDNDLQGFDPQTEEFITERYEFKETFTETKSVVDEHFSTQPETKNGNNLTQVGFGLGVLIIGFVIWKMLSK